MRRAGSRLFVLLPLACMLAVSGVDAAADSPLDRELQKINHIVVIYAENRAFDNLYGLFPGANGVSQAKPENYLQIDNDGSVLPNLPPVWNSNALTADPAFPARLENKPFRIDGPPQGLPLSIATRDLVHRFYQNQEQINGGRLDRYAAVSDAGGLVMGYYDGSPLPLWRYARQYVLADNFFMGAFGGSFVNHFWLVCACTPVFPDAPEGMVSKLDAGGRLARKPASPASALAGPPQFVLDGSLTPDGYAVNTVQPPYQPSKIPPAAGADRQYADASKYPLPPQTQTNIGDTLSAKGITWACYAGSWNAALADGMQAPEAKRTVIYSGSAKFQPHHQPFNYFKRFAPGTKDRAAHLKDENDLLAAIENGMLPQVVFYKPEGSYNEHPGYADVLSGDAHIADIVQRIQAGTQWQDTVIIITYDENGGFWDHVAPPKGDRWGPGMRIPAIIVSPFARKAYVDHTSYDTTSILKFITRRFQLEPLPGVRAGAGDLTPAFDFGS